MSDIIASMKEVLVALDGGTVANDTDYSLDDLGGRGPGGPEQATPEDCSVVQKRTTTPWECHPSAPANVDRAGSSRPSLPSRFVATLAGMKPELQSRLFRPVDSLRGAG